MKKIVAILLFFFFVLQTGQVLSCLFSDNQYGIVMDEDEVGDKNEKEKKGNKDFIVPAYNTGELSPLTPPNFYFAEKVHYSPYSEKLNPPPNFC